MTKLIILTNIWDIMTKKSLTLYPNQIAQMAAFGERIRLVSRGAAKEVLRSWARSSCGEARWALAVGPRFAYCARRAFSGRAFVASVDCWALLGRLCRCSLNEATALAALDGSSLRPARGLRTV